MNWFQKLFCRHQYEVLIRIPVLVNCGTELRQLTLQYCKKCGKRGLFCKDSAYRALILGEGENEEYLREVIDRWLRHEMTGGEMVQLMFEKFSGEDPKKFDKPIDISEHDRAHFVCTTKEKEIIRDL